jgi:hypothetical protein
MQLPSCVTGVHFFTNPFKSSTNACLVTCQRLHPLQQAVLLGVLSSFTCSLLGDGFLTRTQRLPTIIPTHHSFQRHSKGMGWRTFTTGPRPDANAGPGAKHSLGCFPGLLLVAFLVMMQPAMGLGKSSGRAGWFL